MPEAYHEVVELGTVEGLPQLNQGEDPKMTKSVFHFLECWLIAVMEKYNLCDAMSQKLPPLPTRSP